MKRWKSRATAFTICFAVGLLVAFVYSFIAGLLASSSTGHERVEVSSQERCAAPDYFAQPEDLLSALKSDEVSVRREVFRRLFLRPGISTVYYDYERDLEYPERAARARLQYVNLDESTEDEALLTFVRFEHPVALILKKDDCGWKLVAALSSWLRFEEYPYSDWLELPETVRPGIHELLVQESAGDAVSYIRQACLLKLMNGSLEEVARFEEVNVRPFSGYRESDWSDVRQRLTTQHTFLPSSEGQAARVSLDTTDELVKYAGAAPAYTYWLETDGSWHAAHKHWTSRPSQRIKLLSGSAEQLTWNEQEKRFVKVY